MSDLLNLEITLFVLVAVGYALSKLGIVGAEGRRNLTDLVLYVILPCNIITSFLNGAGPDTLKECGVVMLVSCGIQALCVLFGKLAYRRRPEDERVNLSYATICSNAGFLGNPVAEGAFGSTGLMYASVYLIPLRIMMWSEGIAQYSGDSNWKSALKKVLTHPCIIACEIGIVLLVTGWKLPVVVLTPVQTIGKCNTAISMLVIGMILTGTDLKTLVDKTVLLYTFYRLILIPLLVYLFCLPIPMSDTVRGVCVLLVAMPAGTTTSMLAAKYNRKPEFATKLVMFSTLCSIPAIMAWGAVLK